MPYLQFAEVTVGNHANPIHVRNYGRLWLLQVLYPQNQHLQAKTKVGTRRVVQQKIATNMLEVRSILFFHYLNFLNMQSAMTNCKKETLHCLGPIDKNLTLAIQFPGHLWWDVDKCSDCCNLLNNKGRLYQSTHEVEVLKPTPKTLCTSSSGCPNGFG